MKKFLKNIIIGFVGIVIALSLLDTLYSKVYNSSFARNKTQYILSLEKEKKIDYIFLGSSRVENTIMPSVVEKLSNKKALNLGTQGARLNDMTLFLRLLVERKIKIEKLFIQVDYIFNFESSSSIVRSQSLPFIKSDLTINSYLKRLEPNYKKYYYLPFYRYATNDYRLGFRAFFATLIKKKSKIDFNDGFVPVFGTFDKNKSSISKLPNSILEKNKSIIEMDSISEANNIEVIYFCAPFCKNLETNNYLEKLKTKLPNFKDYSSSIPQDSLFNNCSHLNDKGAYVFTKLLVEDLKL